MLKFKNYKTNAIFVSIIVTIFLIHLIYWSGFVSQKSTQFDLDLKLVEPSVKYILYWTPFFDQEDFCIGFGSAPFEKCEYKNCFTTNDKFLFPVDLFDAILFHGSYSADKHGTPWERGKHQRYIFMNLESPFNIMNDLKQYNYFFNWTMTYRFDSDIFRPYSYIIRKGTRYVLPSVDSVKKRHKLVAWFVSNCNSDSERENLTRQLQKYLPVDIYGDCGQYQCAKQTLDTKQSTEECYGMVETNYLFYLSFENSLCKDYVTEKMYNILKRDIVPIVYGSANYSQVAPPHSVIDVEDFNSVEDLANYLVYLSKNAERYIEYFKWKKYFYVETSNQLSTCELCKKLNLDQRDKVYPDLNTWWWGPEGSNCKKKPFLPYLEDN